MIFAAIKKSTDKLPGARRAPALEGGLETVSGPLGRRGTVCGSYVHLADPLFDLLCRGIPLRTITRHSALAEPSRPVAQLTTPHGTRN